MSKHYFVANYTVTDAEGLPAAYLDVVNPMIADQEGAYGMPGEVLEGEPRERVVVLEFESREDFDRWYHSPEYQAVLPLRTSISDGWAVLLEA